MRRKRALGLMVAASLCLLIQGCTSLSESTFGAEPSSAPAYLFETETIPIAAIPANIKGSSLLSSIDGKRTAWVTLTQQAECLVLDGVKGEDYAEISSGPMAFSPNGRRFAFTAKVDGAWRIFVDGAPLPEAFGAAPRHIVFSPDSRRIAFAIQEDDGWHIVADGRKGPAYLSVLAPVFSPDSSRFAYVAVPQDSPEYCELVLDGREKTRARAIRNLIFTPDSQELFYLAVQAEHSEELLENPADESPKTPPVYATFLVRNGSQEPMPEGLSAIALSPKGNVIASSTYQAGKYRVMLGDKLIATHSCAALGALTVSPNGRRVAYILQITTNPDKTQWQVAIGGQTHSLYDAIHAPSLAFSPDGTRVVYFAKRAGRWHLVVNGTESIRSFRAVVEPGQIIFTDMNCFETVVLDGDKIFRLEATIIEQY